MCNRPLDDDSVFLEELAEQDRTDEDREREAVDLGYVGLDREEA